MISVVNDRNNAKVSVVLSNAGVLLTATIATVNIELWNENRGTKSKFAIRCTKGSTDGVYTFDVRDIARYLQIDDTYGFFLTSSEATIDMVSGKIMLVERTKKSDIINRIAVLENQINQLAKSIALPPKTGAIHGLIQRTDNPTGS